jgi:hypothetical protein
VSSDDRLSGPPALLAGASAFELALQARQTVRDLMQLGFGGLVGQGAAPRPAGELDQPSLVGIDLQPKLFDRSVRG